MANKSLPLCFSGCVTVTTAQSKGLQQIECAVVELGSSTTSSEVPWLTLICLCLWVHLYLKGRDRLPQQVTSPTAQEPEAITPKPEGGGSVSRDEIPAEMEPLGIHVGDTRWVYHYHGSYLFPCVPGPFGY